MQRQITSLGGTAGGLEKRRVREESKTLNTFKELRPNPVDYPRSLWKRDRRSKRRRRVGKDNSQGNREKGEDEQSVKTCKKKLKVVKQGKNEFKKKKREGTKGIRS